MPDSTLGLLHRLIGGDPSVAAEILSASQTSRSTPLLVAAALLNQGPELLARADAAAATNRDRQLVALAETYLSGDTDRLDVLVRDHLSEYPDNVLASWIAGRPALFEGPTPTSPDSKDTTS